MIDYLQTESKDIQLYALQQMFQKNYEHCEGDDFNTYFSLTNFSKCKEQQKSLNLDKIILFNPYFFDSKLSQQINIVKCIEALQQKYFSNPQNRLGVLCLSSSDQDIQTCFEIDLIQQIKKIQLEQKNIEFSNFKKATNVINHIKHILQIICQNQREDTILSLTFISPDNFECSELQKEQIQSQINEKLKISDLIQNNKKIILNCLSIGKFDNFLLQQISAVFPQSIYYFCEKQNLIEKFNDLMLHIQNIFITDIETTLTFKHDSNLVNYEVLQYPKNWVKLNEHTYKFNYPFYYDSQELNYLFKLRIQFKGSLSSQNIQETIGFNRSTFTFDNKKYFYERPIYINLIQQSQETMNTDRELNKKCQIAFLNQKFLIPLLQKFLDKKFENLKELELALAKTFEQLNKIEVTNSAIQFYGNQAITKINQFMSQSDENQIEYIQSFITQTLFILQNEIYPKNINFKLKEQKN